VPDEHLSAWRLGEKILKEIAEDEIPDANTVRNY
jgi:hypothetical protein